MNAFPQNVLDFAISTAAANWLEWQRDWEHSGDPACLPVLADRVKYGTKNAYARYRAFMTQYKVLRGIPDETRMILRSKLCSNSDFRSALSDRTGQDLDRLISELATVRIDEEIDKPRGVGRQVAYVSKLAAFAAPARFVASDTFARLGATKVAAEAGFGRYENGEYPDYASYLADVDRLWRGVIGKLIRTEQRRLSPGAFPSIPLSGRAFGKRILDNCLMIAGNRWRVTFGD